MDKPNPDIEYEWHLIQSALKYRNLVNHSHNRTVTGDLFDVICAEFIEMHAFIAQVMQPGDEATVLERKNEFERLKNAIIEGKSLVF